MRRPAHGGGLPKGQFGTQPRTPGGGLCLTTFARVRSLTSTVALALAVVVVVAAPGCANLPDVRENECGNAVVEAHEDCDVYANTEAGQHCYPADAGSGKACRFDCSDEASSCPTGSACGTDKICHFGSSTYTQWGKPLSVSASRILLGDFDGDNRDDLLTLGNPSPLWQRLPKMHFFDAKGNVTEFYDPKMPISSPSIVKNYPASDGAVARQQLLFTTDQGIATLSATPDRQVLPKAYPDQRLRGGWAYRVLTITGNSQTALGDGILVLYSITGENDEKETLLIGVANAVPVAVLPKTAADFVGEPLAANVNASVTSPCSEYLFAYQGDGNAYKIELCDALGAWSTSADGPEAMASLPDGHVIGQPLRVGRVNDDDALDLIVGDEVGQTYVSLGLGDGKFASDLSRPEETLGQVVPLSIDQSRCLTSRPFTGFPLALGDVNQDHRDDWVFPEGILLSRGLDSAQGATAPSASLLGCPGNAPFVGTWTTAYIGDLTGDGLSDLVAAAAGDPDMDFYLGTGLDRMNRFGITTEGSVTRLIGGDFDGDLVGDIAFSTRPVESTGTGALVATDSEEVSIAFGTRTGAPSFIAPLGTFQNVRQLASANYVDSDAISEFGVVSERSAGAGEELAVFVGNPGRHPIAALGLAILSAGGPTYSAMPLAAISGQFDGTPNQESVVAISRSCDSDGPCESPVYRLWQSTLSVGGELGQPVASRKLPTLLETMLATNSQLGLHLLAGDLHGNATVAHPGDGRDELLVLAAGVVDGARTLSLWPMSTSVNIFSTDPDASASDPVAALGKPTQTTAGLLPNSDPSLVDLDGDFFLDLAMIVNHQGASKLAVAWNDTHAHISVKDLTFVKLPTGAPLGLHEHRDVQGRRLFATTEGGTYEISPARDKSRSPVVRPIQTTTEGQSLPGGKALALGDMTGDGLLDFAIAQGGTIRFFAEEEVPPGKKAETP